MEFITNQKGKQSLLWDGSRFTVNRKMDNGTIYWRCCKRTCPARVTTQGSDILTQTNGHNHAVDPTEAKVETIKSNLRKRVREEVTPVPRIYNEALIELSTQEDRSSVAAQLPTFNSLKSSLYRSRRKRFPPIPKSREEIEVDGEFTCTLSGERFICRIEGDADKIIIFATDENLRHLSTLETIYVDGTFQTCPSLFTQLFTINGFIHGQQFPLVYALLPSKSRHDYNRFFTYLKEEMQNLGLQLDPVSVMADFELALVQSIELQFPLASVRGCFFHFSQCIWRKVQSLGLAVPYKDDEEVRSFIQKIAALAFVPLSFIRVAWSAIQAGAPQMQPTQDLASYFQSTWLDGNFPPRTWNYFSHEGPRTNNHIEGWHNRLKLLCGKPHPNLWEFIELLQKEQASTVVGIDQLAGERRRRAKRRKVVQHEEHIKRLTAEFTDGDRSLDSLLNSLSHSVVSFNY